MINFGCVCVCVCVPREHFERACCFFKKIKFYVLQEYIAHLTTVNQPLSRNSSQTSARQLRPSHWGIFCAGHTPEGRGIGLVNHYDVLHIFGVATTTPRANVYSSFIFHICWISWKMCFFWSGRGFATVWSFLPR